MPNYIVTAKHYAKSEGVQTVKERILKLRETFSKQGRDITIEDIGSVSGPPVYARVEQGAWIADCECKGAQFVDPDEPIYFCFNCGNKANDHKLRPVIFPSQEEQKNIEALLLERPVIETRGINDLEEAYAAEPLVVVEVKDKDGITTVRGLARNWNPDETVDDLKKQNKLIDLWKKKVGK